MKLEVILKALADRNRLRILNLLLKCELCVCDIEEILELSQSNVSRHLNKLSQSGLLDSRKEAQWVFYMINKNFREQHEVLIQYLESIFNSDDGFKRDSQKLTMSINSSKTAVMVRCTRK